jgi:hypothetical protein
MANFVSAMHITDKDIALLLTVKKQLVWLKLNNTGVTDSTVSVINQFNNLTELQLITQKLPIRVWCYLEI